MVKFKKSTKQSIVLSTLLYIFYYTFNTFYQNSIFQWSLGFIVDIQSKDSNFLKYYFMILAELGNPYIVIGALTIYIALARDKFTAFKVTFYISVIVYIMSIMKAIIAQPRPYFVDSEVIPYQSYAEYGNPSGHAFICVFGYGYIFYCYRKYKMRSASSKILEESNKIINYEHDENIEIAPILLWNTSKISFIMSFLSFLRC